jgi:CRP/FNR family transcriptional regulator/CRP/FNR family cyclic AMP-dependent transcriptional regulator
MAILDGESRSANVLAQEDCELIVISSEDFLSLLKNNFKVSFSLMSELAKKLENQISRLKHYHYQMLNIE